MARDAIDSALADPLALVQEQAAWISEIYDQALAFVVAYAFDIVGALLVLLAGYVVARWLGRVTLRFQERRNVDITLRLFIAQATRTAVLVLFLIIALGKVGISVTPFVAAIGGLAVGASFALQGPVSNYGAGMLIILTRPFKVGDTIRVLEQAGVVESIHLAATLLTNEDGERITIPNKHIVGEVLTNSWEHRIVEGTVGISYGDEPEKAIEVLRAVLAADPAVAATPPPQVGIQAFGDSAVDIAYRYWVPTKQYFEVQYRVNLAVWSAIRDVGLTIPFPQRDVHLLSPGSEGAH
ncbi:MAG: mechanosensitive ion channel family protein [Pseudomonadales bacterium]|jgi:small conductance mechanosensitive channel|nr:mechanosensitive ion channel family protein [Pseudomonadales bacterium]